MSYRIEEIPDSDRLFYRVHINDFKDGEVVPGAFRERGTGEQKSMSTDWERYSNPQESLFRAAKPERNAIVSFVSGNLRAIGLQVYHSPIYAPEAKMIDNQSHADVKPLGESKAKKTRMRRKLLDQYSWEIKFRA